ncbi:unnamed protein product [Durusdinium trenchii]|uniref:Uncharacterized protein n=1 Tax=Durusdinium trenchii TaxID=1381693 RepID=A0ABP0SN81_9DINO
MSAKMVPEVFRHVWETLNAMPEDSDDGVMREKEQRKRKRKREEQQEAEAADMAAERAKSARQDQVMQEALEEEEHLKSLEKLSKQVGKQVEKSRAAFFETSREEQRKATARVEGASRSAQ